MIAGRRSAADRTIDRRRPILVTGSHRSGTTWVGRLLALADGVAHIHEPLNPVNRLSWLDVPPEHWFQHIDEVNEKRYRPAFERLIALRPPLGQHLATVRSPRNLAANVRELGQVIRWRANHARPVVKDPIALFSAEWLASTFDMQVVLLIRHPAAFAGSLKRNGWTFDFANFTSQPRLVGTYLASFADEIEAATERPLDLVDQAILLWRCINSVVLRYRDEHPDWQVWRYEDLAADPLAGTRVLYEALDLPGGPQPRHESTRSPRPRTPLRWRCDARGTCVETVQPRCGHGSADSLPRRRSESVSERPTSPTRCTATTTGTVRRPRGQSTRGRQAGRC